MFRRRYTMLDTRFGIEIEMTGITRKKAAETLAGFFGTEAEYAGTSYETYTVKDRDGRTWKLMRDGSIRCQLTNERGIRDFTAADRYSVELVTPILTYEKDIETLQEIVRTLRKAGAFTNDSCGIHIHLDGKGHTVRSLRNFISIIYARNDLFYRALGVNSERARYCQSLDERLVNAIRLRNPKTMKELENIWYNGSSESSRRRHYNDTRYHFLNLHSFFHGNKTVELRGFNSTLHAGVIRAYIVFALALDNQARVQKAASTKKPQTENKKFAMRTYLNRIGLIGDEFKACREHLTKNLRGSSAWRHGRAA